MDYRKWIMGTTALLVSGLLSAQEVNEVQAVVELRDTIAVQDTLSDLLKPYFVQKLCPEGEGFRLDTVSILYSQKLGVLEYLNDPATP